MKARSGAAAIPCAAPARGAVCGIRPENRTSARSPREAMNRVEPRFTVKLLTHDSQQTWYNRGDTPAVVPCLCRPHGDEWWRTSFRSAWQGREKWFSVGERLRYSVKILGARRPLCQTEPKERERRMNDRTDIVPALEAAQVQGGLRLWWFGGPSYAIKS